MDEATLRLTELQAALTAVEKERDELRATLKAYADGLREQGLFDCGDRARAALKGSE